MKTIIAGSRNIYDYDEIQKGIDLSGFDVSVVLSGCVKGGDLLGEKWAMFNHKPIMRFPAEWEKYGMAAGPIRNKRMAENAEALVAFWDGRSRGTKNMIEIAQSMNLKVYVHRI